MSAVPQPRWAITSDFTEELMESTTFLAEALAEECNLPALRGALKTGDALAIQYEIETACERYANFMLDHPDYDETIRELKDRLRKAYR